MVPRKIALGAILLVYIIFFSQIALGANSYQVFEKKLKINNKNFTVKGVIVDLNTKKLKMQTVLAKNQIGQVESLESMVKRKKGVIGINGTFFSAYDAYKEPYGNLMIDGRLIRKGNGERCSVGILPGNEVIFGYVKWDISVIFSTYSEEGTELPYIYPVHTLNPVRMPGWRGYTLFTPEGGKEVLYSDGYNIVVEKQKVIKIVYGKTSIPPQGFVLNTGSLCPPDNLLNSNVTLKIEPENQENVLWSKSYAVLEAGPYLVKEGKIIADPLKENFTHYKIKDGSFARSGIGVTKNEKLLLVTVNSATVKELALIMQKLGAFHAMNLDGGASSGLYVNGKYLTKPGRLLSNALVISLN